LVLDGSNVHDVGELAIHVGNWGMLGSMPGSNQSFSHAPSAEWPAGGGVEYLSLAGLWVGAIKNGIPSVSTAGYEFEFRPTPDASDTIYRAAEGDAGGARNVDDDGDGQIDEDWLDGRDNDLDGQIDEDFAAISDQMFSCWYTDNQPITQTLYPQHNPLDIMVRQESYQWADERFDDFVGVEFTITNIGNAVLDQMYVGIFADGDAGIGARFYNWADDATDRVFVPVACIESTGVSADISYIYDADGDRGLTPGYFGVQFLGHTTDPTGDLAPPRVGISSYTNFIGGLPFESGGDPRNDFERYELLSQQTIERGSSTPQDYRVLISAGPFNGFAPDSTIVFQVAFVAGLGHEDMWSEGGIAQNAAYAKLAFNGTWSDADGDPLTGVAGRETPVFGPATNVRVDTCACPECPPIPFVPEGDGYSPSPHLSLPGSSRVIQLRLGLN
jgi:hypothetical protein